MANFYASYLPGVLAGVNESVSANGAPIPPDSTLVAGENPSGNQEPLQTDASGNLYVNVNAGSITALNPSVSMTGMADPAYATYVGMSVGGDLTGLTGTANGLKVDGSAVTQPISAVSLPLPTGAATNAELVTINATLGSPFQAGGSIGNTSFIATQATASNLNAAVVGVGSAGTPSGGVLSIQGVAGGQAVPISGSITATNPSVSATGSAVPADATYAGMNVSGNLTGLVGTANGLKVDGSAVTQPVSGTVTADQGGTWTVQPGNTANTTAWLVTGTGGTFPATQSGTWNINNISGTVSLPTGASTAANQSTIITDLGTIITNTTGLATSANQTNASQKTQIVDGSGNVIASTSNALNVAITSGGSTSTSIKGTASANAPVYNVYSSTNITTSAYVQLVASTSNAINTLHIFDSSGQAMILGVGASGSEVIQLYVPPGGDTYTLNIPSGSRIAYKALTATASSGYLLMSFLE